MISIILSNGMTSTVDAQDADLLQYTWHGKQNDNGVWYAYRAEKKHGRQTNIYMHRQITKAATGTEVDHWDGNGLNNCRYNLRVCTTSQNQCNRKKSANKTSQFKGVSWHKRAGKYRAYIKLHGKTISLGYYEDESQAARAYNIKAHELFGQYARLNIL